MLAIGMGYQRHVERVMVYELERVLKEHGIAYDYNKSTASIKLFNGSEIIFGSADNPTSLEGPHVDGGCWIDEAGYMPRLAWDVATRRTDFHQAPILVTSVPYFLNWLKTDLYDHWIGACDCAAKGVECYRDQIDWIPCRSYDNLEYSDTVLKRIKATRRPEYYDIYIEGKFARPFGLIYGDPDNSDIVVDPSTTFPHGIPNDWPCYSGHDFGINDPNAALWARLAPDGTLFIVAEYQAPQLTMARHVERWKKAGLDAVDGAWGDPSGADQMMTAAENGYNIEKANNDILYGIDLVDERFRSGKLKVFAGCRTVLDMRATYVWKKNPKNEDELIDQPEDPQPARHIMDALRYLVVGIFENTGIQNDSTYPTMRIRSRRLM
jgi:hypothetical protein